MFIKPTSSLLIITDRDKTGGIITGGLRSLSGTVISRGYLTILEKMLFGDNTKISEEQFSKSLNNAGFRGFKEPSVSLNRQIIRSTPGIGRSQSPAEVGRPTTREVKEGTIKINGKEMWHPAGKMTIRKFDRRTAVIVQAKESLAGQVDVVEKIDLAGMGIAGPGLHVSAASCGACGLCGLCGLCGEINALSAAAAITAVSALSSVAFDPSRVDVSLEGIRERAKLGEVPLLEAAESLKKILTF